jgi:hypothetical protein
MTNTYKKPIYDDKSLAANMQKRQDIWDEMFIEESDRSVGVLGGALIDESLKELFKFKFTDDYLNAEQILSYPNVLGSVGARIEIARAFGIIGQFFYEDLKAINDIRNFFAHSTLVPNSKHKLSSISFDSQRPSDLCKKLSHYKEFERKYGRPLKTRLCFEHSVSWAASCISAAIHFPKQKIGKRIKI